MISFLSHEHKDPAVAQLQGVHRQTLGHWLAIDEARGLDALLDLYVPAGQPLSLPPDVLAAIAQALQPPTGLASYEALRQWGQQTSPPDVNFYPLDTHVRTQLKTTLTGARPSHTQNRRGPSGVSGDVSGAAAAGHPA